MNCLSIILNKGGLKASPEVLLIFLFSHHSQDIGQKMTKTLFLFPMRSITIHSLDLLSDLIKWHFSYHPGLKRKLVDVTSV